MNFSEKLKLYRKENNLTQEALAEQLKISRQAVSKWEQGRGYPDIKTIEDLSRLMDVTIDELISNKEIKTLTVDSANKINKAVKKFFIAICSVSLALVVALTTIIGILVFKPKEELKGLVGFYIDVSQDDGAFSLYQPNGVDIYYYKLAGVEGGYVKNGILHEETAYMQYLDGTSYFSAECAIVLDMNITGEFILYDILENKDGHLTAQKSRTIEHAALQSALTHTPAASIYFKSNDYINSDGKHIGRTFNFYLTYKALPTKIKVVQYADNTYNEVLEEHTILPSTTMPEVPHPQPFARTAVEREADFVVRILEETQAYQILETFIIDGLEVEQLVSSQNFMVSMTATREIHFANVHGYVSKAMTLLLTNQ